MTAINHIIVDGPEGTAKQKLVKRLAETLGWRTDSVETPNPTFSFYEKKYAQENVIFTSSHLGGCVQSMYWNGKDPFTKEEKNKLNILAQENGRVILVFPPNKGVMTNEEWKYYVQQGMEIERIRLMYWIEFNNTKHITWDGNIKQLEEITKQLKQEIDETSTVA